MDSPPSLHQRLVLLLEQDIAGRASISDVSVSGAEEVVLDLGIEGAGGAGRPAGSRALHLMLVTPFPLFWLSERGRASQPSRSGFADWMRRRFVGARIEGVSAGESGRILRLSIRHPRSTDARDETDAARSEDDTSAALILDPLPNACRLLVLDAAGRVEQRYPPTLHATPGGRGSTGDPYREPAGRPAEIWTRAVDARGMDETQAEALHVCAVLSSEIAAARSGAPTSPSVGSDAAGISTSRPETPSASIHFPRAIVFLSPRPSLVTGAISLSPAGPLAPWRAAEVAGEAWIKIARHERHLRALRQILSREARGLAALEAKLAAETIDAQRGTLLRRQAEALLANSGRVPKGIARVSIDDPSSHGAKIEIDLDPKLSFSQNAALLFRKAARMERALPQRQHRVKQAEDLRHAISEWMSAPFFRDPWHPLRPWIDESEAGAPRERDVPLPHEDEGTRDALHEARRKLAALDPGLRKRWQRLLDDWQAAHRDRAEPIDHSGYEGRKAGGVQTEAPPILDGARSGPGKEDAAATGAAGIRPRRYELPGGWIVLVGRSNRENDILTHRLARPDDLWFHARGAAGSHVVLRRGGRKDNPPQDIIRRTAAIAAFHSKARTSAMVPVVYTEKRYVRKPRKGAAGLALCLREKVMMVEPALPAEGP